VISPAAFKSPRVPRLVRDDVTTFAASVVPVTVPAAAVTVQEEPSVQTMPLTVDPVLTRSAFVTRPVARKEPVTVRFAIVPMPPPSAETKHLLLMPPWTQ
jgi:hypothetical protein